MLTTLEAPASTPVTTPRCKGVHPLTKAELQAIIDRHNSALTDAFHHDVLLAQGFPGHQPWANESFHDPVVNAYLMERYATPTVN
ncbi:MAG: hypothetical protein DI628_04810 [Blastochloris viridis]|uniref:Uncharacterized protein n=1 Tax=Blastochloris viridis TaxID=1079 RepID=A0A6N4R5N6_BLAVI|nr:MAG: hypothetical protein DI628_04810 [Blastochloris viridis]